MTNNKIAFSVNLEKINGKNSIDLSKYRQDKSIPNIYWNIYLLKYEDKYLITHNGDYFWYIYCEYGMIYPSSIIDRRLYFIGFFKDRNKLLSLNKKSDGSCKISKNGATDIVVFNEELLDTLSEIFHCYRK